MRNIFIVAAALAIAAIGSVSAYAADREWKETPGGLPYYRYVEQKGSDDAILIGNNRVKIRTHANGIYELMSGDRCWGLFNADPIRPYSGKNRATVYMGRKKTELVGYGSLATVPEKCKVYTGAGFVRYDYDLGNDIRCSRMISVMPSETLEGGAPLFLVTLTFSNEGKSAKSIAYDEAISPNYVQAPYQLVPQSERPLHYNLSTEINFRCIKALFGPVPQQFVPLATPDRRTLEEFAPHSVFIYSDNAFLVVNDGELKASIDEFRLRPRRKHTFHIVVGFSGENNREMAEKAVAASEGNEAGGYASMWKKHLPNFSSEKNIEVRNELYRSAYSIEAATVYDDYFKEAFISGNISQAFKSGENLSNKDHIHAALQACFTDPGLAKSIIRYVMKQTTFDGMISNGNKGFGYIPSDSYRHELVQLDVLNAVTEYVSRTGDYDFLDEWIHVYPMERGEMLSVKSIIESYFLYIRDAAYPSAARSAMQAAYLPAFVEQMERSGKFSAEFMDALKKYTDKALNELEQQNEYDVAELSYLLQTTVLTDSQKRDLLDRALYGGKMDLQMIFGILNFDALEAGKLFRNYMTEEMDSNDIDVWDSWAIYNYFRLKY